MAISAEVTVMLGAMTRPVKLARPPVSTVTDWPAVMACAVKAVPAAVKRPVLTAPLKLTGPAMRTGARAKTGAKFKPEGGPRASRSIASGPAALALPT